MSKKSARKKTRSRNTRGTHTPKKRAHAMVLGHSASAVCRWMGANGWKNPEARKAITALCKGGTVKPATIDTGLSDGRSGKWGKPAPITRNQSRQLRAAARG
jgi:hypothetical protein